MSLDYYKWKTASQTKASSRSKDFVLYLLVSPSFPELKNVPKIE